ncbi:MAG: NADH-quinone oxidoreductase subunit L [Phycisphaerales bacterium]|nr:NADH-quinone oxidoreductase subunit L [Phycisphaerales bacterium]
MIGLSDMMGMLVAADAGGAAGAAVRLHEGFDVVALIPVLPLLASVACLGAWVMGIRSKTPAWVTVGTLAGSFVIALMSFLSWRGSGGADVFSVYDWIPVASGGDEGPSLLARFGFYMDGLSWLWMLFVTGLATLIALYASEYMEHDKGRGYCRFFAAFCLFVFSMSCLVMGNNLVLLYLGWEGVGLCSYLLIGYFYKKPSAVAAAKKAFIVNRIGDLGLALGLFLTFTTFGTIQYDEIFSLVNAGEMGNGLALAHSWQAWAIPALLMIGAFGKSAQFPLYVWLPDAMEGPTPVSALIHAATMVTAGVYLIARMFPLFSAYVAEDGSFPVLTVVAWVGAITALLAATIGMAQFDIKRIMAYSTVSQLGYMFAGLGLLSTTGAVLHVFTHAFFKALLFLACGAVMHGFAGQLDLRKLSGLRKMPGWGIVSFTMLIGCLNLAGFPIITSGFFSKDTIMAEAFVTPGGKAIGIILLLTAGMTAYYTFRVYFRVFEGPEHFEPGDEHHGSAEEEHAAHEAHAHDDHGHAHGHEHFHPHAPKWAINTVLLVLAVLSFVAIPLVTGFTGEHHGWAGGMVHDSSARFDSPFAKHHAMAAPQTNTSARIIPVQHEEPAHATPANEDAHAADSGGHEAAGSSVLEDPHKWMYLASSVVGLIGIAAAWWLHLVGRTEAATSRADALLPFMGPIPKWAQDKWYVDEFYDFAIRRPLRALAHVFHLIDKLLVDGLVNAAGFLPRAIAHGLKPSQGGVLHGYAVGMASGIAFLLLVILVMVL